MPWRRFVLFNGIGGTLWATAIGLAAYAFGRAAVSAVTSYGLYALIVIVVLALVSFLGYRAWRRRRPEPPRSESAGGTRWG